MFTKFALALVIFSGAPLLLSQATPTASRTGDLLVGGGFTSAASDYGRRFNGYNIYADFDFTRHLGAEANFHFVSHPAGVTLYEKTYELGARYRRTYGAFVPYGRVMYGRGVFNFPPFAPPAPQNEARANLAYNLLGVGIGTDLKVRRWLYLRADYEYQQWYSFPEKGGSGLTPQLLTFGAAYHF